MLKCLKAARSLHMTHTLSLNSLCRLHTNLAEVDIQKIDEVAKNLPLIADLNRANVFIDCLTKKDSMQL